MSFLFQIRTEQAHHSHPVLIDQAAQTSQPNFQSGEQNAGCATISNDGVGKYVKRAELLIKSQISQGFSGILQHCGTFSRLLMVQFAGMRNDAPYVMVNLR